jgi:hypothetical protein
MSTAEAEISAPRIQNDALGGIPSTIWLED